MLENVKKSALIQTTVIFFVFFTVWWLIILFFGLKESSLNYLFAAVYGLMAMWGGCWGIVTAEQWGGVKSIFGRAILFLSVGLLAAEFGQIVFSFYNIFLHVEIPYPSLADFGFFMNIPLYSLGIFYLAKASGVQVNMSKMSARLQIIILPICLLTLSYIFFLREYQFDWSNPLKIFLDFGYPLGQAIYVSLALLTYSLSRNVLGGMMKKSILFLLFAFVAQYIADYNFLFQNSRGTWYNGGYGDYLYLVAYFLMAIGLLQLRNILQNLRA